MHIIGASPNKYHGSANQKSNPLGNRANSHILRLFHCKSMQMHRDNRGGCNNLAAFNRLNGKVVSAAIDIFNSQTDWEVGHHPGGHPSSITIAHRLKVFD